MTSVRGSTPSFLDSGALAFAAPLFQSAEPPNRAWSRDGVVYDLERELGCGGMAKVHLARDPKHDRWVALKVLDAAFTSPDASERFVLEIRVTGRLQHPLIVGLVDSGVFADDSGSLAGRPYYTMPYVQGESLRDRLARGAVSLSEALRVLQDVAEALAYAHAEGVVHRDIKPANILLSRGHAVVADFGIATAISLSQSDAVPTGTPAYMAPEQTVPDTSVDARSDLYAYGLVAYELLAGCRPFAEKETADQLIAAHRSEMPMALEHIAPAVPRPLAMLVMQLLAKNPSDRPRSAEEVLRVLQTTSVSPEHVGTSRHGRWRTATTVLLLVALGIGAYLAFPRRAQPALRTNNAGARDLYQLGRRFWQQRTPASMRTAIWYFERAIAADSNFANAYAGLADACNIAPLFEVGSPRDLFPKAKRAALRALALDSTLAEAHASLARVAAQYDGDPVVAERELRRAIALDPGNAISHQRYAQLLLYRGRPDDAFREINVALSLEPLSRLNNFAKSTLLSLAGRSDSAIAQLRYVLQLDPEFAQAHASLGTIYLNKRKPADAVRELETALRYNQMSFTAGLLAYAYAASGQRARAQAILQEETERARQHYVAPATFAIIYAGLGDSAQAIPWLERASEIRDPNIGFVLTFKFLDWMHADPRVTALLKHVDASCTSRCFM